jgi:hypothetical protein
MHPIYNPVNLLGKRILISFYKDFPGEYAKVIDIGENDVKKYAIEFEKAPDDIEDSIIWIDEEPDTVDENGAYFTTIGEFGNFYLKIEEEQEQKLEYNTSMKTTVKELSDKLGVDVVYINGFLKTLEKLGKASVVGKVERPAGTKGKPASIYEIQEGIL